MDFLNDDRLKINANYNFWKYAEVMELNKHTVTNTRPEIFIEDGVVRVAENEANSKRKSISVFNTVERLKQLSKRIHKLPPGVGKRQGHDI